MNNYIVLDSFKYATNAANWRPVYAKPHTERRTLTGVVDVTYGPSTLFSWEGEIVADVTPRDAGWGTIADLRTTLLKKQAIAMTDHDGVVYNVHCLGDFTDRSLINVWDSSVNKYYIQVRLVKS